jgi:broad specificity phosphatase PhoE
MAGRAWSTLPAGFEQAPADGETLADCQQRLMNALNALPRGGDVAVVTHNDAIALLIRTLFPGLAEAPGLGSGRGIEHGSISELRRGVGGWRVIRIADDRHLRARADTVDLLT